jgi:hypothetical protein
VQHPARTPALSGSVRICATSFSARRAVGKQRGRNRQRDQVSFDRRFWQTRRLACWRPLTVTELSQEQWPTEARRRSDSATSSTRAAISNPPGSAERRLPERGGGTCRSSATTQDLRSRLLTTPGTAVSVTSSCGSSHLHHRNRKRVHLSAALDIPDASEELSQRLAAEPAGRPAVLSQDVVDRIRLEHTRGRALAEIARDLTAGGIPTAHGGRQWWPSTVRAVLLHTVSEVK